MSAWTLEHRARQSSEIAVVLSLLLVLVAAVVAAEEPAEGTDAQRRVEETTAQKPQDAANAETDETTLRVYDEIEIRGRRDDLVGLASSATEGWTGYRDLQMRPLLRLGELVETTPGLIATQHSGSGKANQYYLRGFNLDHGTDFSFRVAGVPVNMPTHGHGQGYADLNFLIPELVDRARYRKGPYYADRGDFSVAGGVDIELVHKLPERIFSITGGSYDFGRLFLADSFETGGGDLIAAIDVSHSDGPWQRADDYVRVSTFARYSRGGAERGFSLTAMGYDGSWLATDQVPRRAVGSGLIDRFGLIDPGPRGSTTRYSLSGELHRGRDHALTRLEGYLLFNDFGLISNFTYFLEDEENGDQFEQVDQRLVAGLEASHLWLGSWKGRSIESTVGIELRADDIENALYRTRDLIRTNTTREDEILQLSGGPYIATKVGWSDKVKTRFGLRAEIYYADVTSNLELNSDRVDDYLLSPKLSLILGPWNRTEVYLNFGYGFHSNDARGAALRIDPVTARPVEPASPLVRARGGDIGVRTAAIPGLHTTVSLFALEFDSELIFIGDGGATEAARPSRRLGIEWTNHYQLRPWLACNLDVALTRARFSDDRPAGDRIPGAIDHVVTAAVSISNLGRFFGALRLRYFGAGALVEDNSVRSSSSSLVNGRIGYKLKNGLSLVLEGFNLFDRDDSDVEYFYASRLPGEPAGGIEDIHSHPAEPISLRLMASWRS